MIQKIKLKNFTLDTVNYEKIKIEQAGKKLDILGRI